MTNVTKWVCLGVCLCFLLCSQVRAQGYLPIVKENAEWTVLKVTLDTRLPPPPDPIDTSYVKTWIQGDTLISDIIFKKVFSREFSPGDNRPVYQGAIREENQVINWIPNGRGIAQQYTIYNFNLKVGDTIAVYRQMTTFYHYVQSIDSVILKDGIKRKRLNIYSKNVGEFGAGEKVNSWIEGLGELQYGLIYPFCQQSFAPRCLDGLICYKEAGSVVYEREPLACVKDTSVDTSMVFAPIGAEWIFNYSFAGNEGYQRITSQGDTIINGKSCKKLLWEKFFLDNVTPQQDTTRLVEGYRYTHQAGDTIFYYDTVKNQFTTLFVFNAKVGDTILVPLSARHQIWPIAANVRFNFIINNVSTISINGVTGIKTFDFKAGGCSAFDVNVRTRKFIERIGTTSFLFFNEIDCAGFVPDWSLRCYSDNEINYKVSERSCDFLSSAKKLNKSSSVKIYPNPVSETLFIETQEIVERILIFDSFGRPLKQFIKPTYISVTDFQKGIYWLEALDSHNRRLGVSSFIVK